MAPFAIRYRGAVQSRRSATLPVSDPASETSYCMAQCKFNLLAAFHTQLLDLVLAWSEPLSRVWTSSKYIRCQCNYVVVAVVDMTSPLAAQPWFIATLVSLTGGAFLVALCVCTVCLIRQRNRFNKQTISSVNTNGAKHGRRRIWLADKLNA